MYTEKLIKERNIIKERIAEIEKKIVSLPCGELICTRSGKYFKWFVRTNDTLTYLPKSQKDYALALARKKYLQARLDDLTAEKNQLDFLISSCNEKSSHVSQLSSVSSPYHNLLKEIITDNYSPDETIWMHQQYTKNPEHPENLKLKTLSGEYVRSKSEMIIANALYLNNIPYRYECEFRCNSGIYFPDFTTLHPKSGKIMYWEHFGLMDSPSYRNKCLKKLKDYGDSGIIPSINLILTYETEFHPLDSVKVNSIIEEYFL